MVMVAAGGRSSCPQCLAVFRGGFQRCPRDGALLSTVDRDPLVGTTLADRYVIESVIGEGGIGRVYRARHARMSRRYAIKVPFGELGYDAKVRARFLHEAEATSRLSHPNVIGVVDVGETPAGLLYMAMDLAEGTALSEVIHHEGALSRERALRIIEQMAEGLGHAHERGLVHRDLKPENVILEPDGEGGDRVRIVDFGIAILRDADGQSGRLTTEGIVLGTPHYMAPEQACNLPVDHRTDLFALGLILYEMLAGVLPFDGTPVEVARKNLGADPPRISERVPGLRPDAYLEALAFWLMKKRPEDRPQRAADVVETIRLIEADPLAAAAKLRLGDLEAGLVPPRRAPPAEVAAPAPAPERADLATDVDEPRPARRRGAWIAVLLALLGAVVFMITWVASRGRGVATPADAGPAPVVTTLVDAAAAPAPVDAAAEVALPAVDAAPAVVAVTEPRVSGRRPKRTEARPAVDAGATAPVTPPEPPTKASLTALYEQVGRELDAVITARGKAFAQPYARRYQDIPYLEATRKPDLRAEAMAHLRALSRDLAKVSN